jgi:3-hydroxyisobutyrate dehydrogenase-like beta-hydroxyacid dehydrogenase
VAASIPQRSTSEREKRENGKFLMPDRRIAFIGLGKMGSGMALRLARSGFKLTVYNRTAAKAAPVVEAGAVLAASAASATREADLVMLSLSDEAAVEEVLFGELLAVMTPGTYVVDTSTVSPAYARSAAARLEAAGLHRVEACVIGNPVQAAKGQLRVCSAGDAAQVVAVSDVLETLGHQVTYLGPAGTAATVKLVFNAVLGVQVAAMAEAVTYGLRAGLDRDLLLRMLIDSGFTSLVMKFRGELMLTRAYDTAYFRGRLMEKDLRLALEGAGQTGTSLPVLASARDWFAELTSAGAGDQDAAALLEIVADPTRPAPSSAG